MTDEELLPLSITYCKLLFAKLRDHSEEVKPENLIEYGFPANETESVRIFKGFVKDLANELGFREAIQNRTMGKLYAMRAITTIRRGGPRSPTVIVLNYEPTDEQYLDFVEQNSRILTRTTPTKDDLYQRDIADLRIRVQKVEAALRKLETTVEQRNDIRGSS